MPETLLLDSAQSWAEVERRSQLLLALKYFELGQVTSGQAAAMCGIARTAFLTEASRLGVPVAELSDDEIADEFTRTGLNSSGNSTASSCCLRANRPG